MKTASLLKIKKNQKEEKNSLSQEVSDTVKDIKEKAVESGNAVVDTVKKSVADEISESIQKETKEQIEQLQKEETDINTDNK